MKIINLARGQGKTTRLLYASEFNDIPIVFATHQQKDYLKEKAKQMQLLIPEPIVVSEFTRGGIKRLDSDVLIDEIPMVLQTMFRQLGLNGEIKAITLSEKDNNLWEKVNPSLDNKVWVLRRKYD